MAETHLIFFYSYFYCSYKRDVKLMDLQSTQMLGAYGFLARVFGEFEKHKLSVDVLASSEVSVSLTLDKKQNVKEIDDLVKDLGNCACVEVHEEKSILTLIADVERSSEVLATVFKVFASKGIKVSMMSQGASKVNISFIVDSSILDRAILELHKCFFEDICSVEKYRPEKVGTSGVATTTKPLLVQP
jgi:aspartate kinase